MAWWVWLLVGLGLLGFEMLTPGGFFILFFGLGALVVGTLAGLGLTEPVWLQWLLFSLLSVGSLLLFRRRLLAWLQSPEATAVASPIGDVAVLLADLPPAPWARRSCAERPGRSVTTARRRWHAADVAAWIASTDSRSSLA
jgi:membrane protein implicated in regulation of membrane protease activity